MLFIYIMKRFLSQNIVTSNDHIFISYFHLMGSYVEGSHIVDSQFKYYITIYFMLVTL